MNGAQIELKGNLSNILEVNCLEQIVVCLQEGNKIPPKIYYTHSVGKVFLSLQHAPANLNITIASIKLAIKAPCLPSFCFAARRVDIGRMITNTLSA